MSNEAQEHLEKLSDSELEELYKDLLSFANFRLDFNDTQGLSAEDFVNRAIRKVIDSDSSDHRTWNPKKEPVFNKFLKSCVSSEISNHFRLKSTKITGTAASQDDEPSFFDKQESNSQVLSEIEGEELRSLLFDELVEHDEELAELLFFQEEGYSVSEIVKKLNYKSASNVYNARKRLRRVCRNFLNKY